MLLSVNKIFDNINNKFAGSIKIKVYMSKELQDKAEQMIQELNEALIPIREELERLRSMGNKNTKGRKI